MKIAATIVRESNNSFLAWSPSLPDNWQVRATTFRDAFKRVEDAIYAFYDVFLGLPKAVFWLNVLDAAEEGRAGHHRSLVVVTGRQNQPVRFSIRPGVGAKEVRLAGDFNQWKPEAMPARGENVFSQMLTLPPGVYEYRFVIDGRWSGSPLRLPEAPVDLSILPARVSAQPSAMARA